MSGSGYSGSRPRPLPPGPRPEPVKVIKPDGAAHVGSAYEFKNRPDQGSPEPMGAPPSGEELNPSHAVTLELLEEMTMLTLYRVMRDSEKLSERTGAAAAAVKYIAIKLRVGPLLGEDLDND